MGVLDGLGLGGFSPGRVFPVPGRVFPVSGVGEVVHVRGHRARTIKAYHERDRDGWVFESDGEVQVFIDSHVYQPLTSEDCAVKLMNRLIETWGRPYPTYEQIFKAMENPTPPKRKDAGVRWLNNRIKEVVRAGKI